VDILKGVVLLCLLAVFIQDWKSRKIHVVLPVALFLASYFLVTQQRKGNITLILYNAFIFMIILTVMILYMSLKNKRFLNPFQNYFGLGDFLFFIAITPLFLRNNYILFIILAMVFSLVVQVVFRRIIKRDMVPLAGLSALLLAILCIKDMLFDFNPVTLL